jgi:hypothetical protein
MELKLGLQKVETNNGKPTWTNETIQPNNSRCQALVHLLPASVQVCCGSKCCAKTILLSQTGMSWL